MKILIAATANPGKLREIQAYLQELPWSLQPKPPEIEIEETGATFLENACLKAAGVARATQQWAIADDSGLEVSALDGAPGLYSARYGPTDAERIARLLRELGENAPDRSARFVCALAIAAPDGRIAASTEAHCPGEILRAPKGDGGFGYDPVFWVPETGQTYAQMSPDTKHRLSHRGRAFAALRSQLQQLALAGPNS